MISHDAEDLKPLEQRRLALGYSRERLGAAAGGISSATVKRVERGRVRPHPATRVALARALGCRVADLFPDHEENVTQVP
jgi:transcriptional regulator with XRE-family HTH domain